MGSNYKSLTLIVLFLGTLGVGSHLYRNKFIKNLEPDAIYCGITHNFVSSANFDFNLPKFLNSDINDNGKYESIFIYLNNRGERLYKEITKSSDGNLIFGKPKPYTKNKFRF
jgi:hypothetical protein